MVNVTPVGSATAAQLWGYDGAGWWLLAEVDPGDALATPIADGGGSVVTLDQSTGTLAARDLGDLTTAATLASPFSVTTRPLDAGEPEQPKRWLRVGVELARLDGAAVGEWTAALDYSTDAGSTWQSAGPATSVTTTAATVEHAIDADALSLLLRVTMSRVSGLPPSIPFDTMSI